MSYNATIGAIRMLDGKVSDTIEGEEKPRTLYNRTISHNPTEYMQLCMSA